MQRCVIYARVSTKDQQNEGYSIPAQLKAIRAFCASEGLTPAAEFIEAESAGKAGRKRFTEMVAFLSSNPDIKTVVAHKLDRLYRNFRDQITLEEDLGARARYVVGDIPDTPQGELLRDVNLSVSKYYLGNLAEEVKKGMEEKVAQGGWPHKAPLGYLNDKNTRSLVLDDVRAPLIRFAFERYASGVVSVRQLGVELFDKGLRQRSGRKIYESNMHQILSNPLYAGYIRYKGEVSPGSHTPIVSKALFDEVQERLSGNRHGVVSSAHVYSMRGVLYCAECGCKITAGTHKGHVYYRCTRSKGDCSQRSYVKEDVLAAQINEILLKVAIKEDVVQALGRDAALLLEKQREQIGEERGALEGALARNKDMDARLLDAYLEGNVPADTYSAKAGTLEEERRALELRLHDFDMGPQTTAEQVMERARIPGKAWVAFEEGSEKQKQEVLAQLLCNARVKDGRIASYQYKDPFGVLEMDSSGAFIHEWWAIWNAV